METIVSNFHDENDKFVGELNLKSGSDAEGVEWMDVDSSLKLFASHSEFLYQVAKLRKSHWK
jgi:ADP-ribose pyrophosphatase